ncbi:metaxin-1 [Prorops nasuta]|uniref:metaxin-1 n=1 Tax=Prorops nasuta TaxID=863751 RepID=UPI0034CD2E4A
MTDLGDLASDFIVVNVALRMSVNEKLELDIWKGDWGLPSIDVTCLQILAYSKFSKASLKINTTCNPFRSKNGNLPVLRTNHIAFNDVQSMKEFLKSKNYNPDSILSLKQCANVVAYESMLFEKLYPALQYIWWVDQQNINELVKPWYSEAVPFPFNFYYPGKFERQAKAMLESLYPMEDDNIVLENKIYAEAQKCITLLSVRLGEDDFFFGSLPTSLDAIVFSYLAPLLKAPLPHAALQNHLKACTNLVKFVSRISQRYFEYEYQVYEKKTAENIKKLRRNSENEYPNKRRNQILAGIFAGFAMLVYAFSNGMGK